MYGYYGGYGHGPLDAILWVILWIVAIGFILRLVRGGRPGWRGMWSQHHGGWREKDALDILKERYAKGEINKQEFEEKKADLMKQ
jgi:putative membrane protein